MFERRCNNRPRWLVAGVVVLALTAGACGSSSDDDPAAATSPSSATAAFPVTVQGDNGVVEVAAAPTAIVSLSPTATEMLFAIGAGEQVVAVDDQSDFPAEVPTTDLSGFEPNVEAIADFDPDLVVYATDPGDLQTSLDKLGIPALQQNAPVEIAGTYDQISALGLATGHSDEADALNEAIRSEIEAIVASVPDASGLSYYHELDPTLFTATADSFIGGIYELIGLQSIAENVPDAASGYVQLSQEHIIDSDPDLIFLADSECCNESAESVAKRAGWKHITAVRSDAVFDVPDDIASRWGPRITEFLAIVASAVNEATG